MICKISIVIICNITKVFGLVNLALNKPTRQINDYGPLYHSSQAVDGKLSSFSHTNFPNANVHNWWIVDLEAIFIISQVNIRNRQDCCDTRLTNFTISIWEYDPGPYIKANMNAFCICAHHPGTIPQGQWKNFTCSRTCAGRFVLIVLHNDQPLSLVEVQVFGNEFSCNSLLSSETKIKELVNKKSSPNPCSPVQHTVYHITECSLLCLQLNNCISFNYNPNLFSSINCILITCFTHPLQDLQTENGWMWRYLTR